MLGRRSGPDAEQVASRLARSGVLHIISDSFAKVLNPVADDLEELGGHLIHHVYLINDCVTRR